MITAEEVREAMIEQEISQRQLSYKSNVSASVISSWLSGRAEPSDISKARIALALGLPADAEPEAISRAEEDIAAEKILDILQPEPEPEPESEPTPEPEPEPEPEPAPEPKPAPRRYPRGLADMLYELTRQPGVSLNNETMTVTLRPDESLRRFLRSLEALDTMLEMGDIEPEIHTVAEASILGSWHRREAGEC